ncbi:SRPBCC family protein [Paraburkholderia pallida]|uniref:SRPBCC domain-containing protein n=1 Tax=Paraburkholderia pallida TaxID=2547399 RepID=A0A4P7D187_9BURK|nr:SRPBCC domain-containing protein [Paraburkholderia pallida]QBR00184.1 SRPBCC domain-containing protein [Paraburkholderia pallida]
MTDKLSAPFVIERRFAAPRELVYAALTEARHLSAWMSPPGMELSHCTVDARVGGVFHYAMRPRNVPDAPAMWGKWTFRELTPPERIVVVVQFSDADGGVTRHPMAEQWPLYTLSTTTLSEVENGTLMHLEWRALDASEAEEAIFDASHASMSQGWGGTMDALDKYLVQQQADR